MNKYYIGKFWIKSRCWINSLTRTSMYMRTLHPSPRCKFNSFAIPLYTYFFFLDGAILSSMSFCVVLWSSGERLLFSISIFNSASAYLVGGILLDACAIFNSSQQHVQKNYVFTLKFIYSIHAAIKLFKWFSLTVRGSYNMCVCVCLYENNNYGNEQNAAVSRTIRIFTF